MGGHLLAELKAIILIGDASENFVECIFMDLFHWAERILIDSNLYFLMNVLWVVLLDPQYDETHP